MNHRLRVNALHFLTLSLLLACQPATVVDSPPQIEPPLHQLNPDSLQELPLEPLPIGPGSTGPKPGVTTITSPLRMLDVSQLAAIRNLRTHFKRNDDTVFQLPEAVALMANTSEPLQVSMRASFEGEAAQSLFNTPIDDSGTFKYSAATLAAISTRLNPEGKTLQGLAFVLQTDTETVIETWAEPLSYVCGEQILLLQRPTEAGVRPPAAESVCPPGENAATQ